MGLAAAGPGNCSASDVRTVEGAGLLMRLSRVAIRGSSGHGTEQACTRSWPRRPGHAPGYKVPDMDVTASTRLGSSSSSSQREIERISEPWGLGLNEPMQAKTVWSRRAAPSWSERLTR